MLEYDNSAFYYFMLTLLAFYIAPAGYYNIKYIWNALVPSQTEKQLARTSVEKKKAKSIIKANSGLAKLASTGFLAQLAILSVAVTLFGYLVHCVWSDHELATFDPYKILGVAAGEDDKEVKKAYRRMSLEYHPDKCEPSKRAQCEDMFMKIAKAYEALTDEDARRNWEEFGNPDGKQSLEVSIGLPTFLLDAENHNAILVVYLMILVVVIPLIVAVWYSQSKKYGENNVMYDTYRFYLQLLSEHTSVKMLPEVYAGSAEFRTLNSSTNRTDADRTVARNLFMKIKASGAFYKPRIEHPIVMRGNLLMHAHLLRMPLEPADQKALDKMLRQYMRLMDAMLELTTTGQQRWMQTTKNIIDFSQCMTQGLWVKDHWLLQLPHFTEKELQHALKGKKPSSLRAYLDQTTEEKKGLRNLSDDQVADVVRVGELLPNVEVDVRVDVEDEEEIAEKDLCTLRVHMLRKHAVNGRAPPVHAPHFPVSKPETWFVILADKAGSLITLDKITNQSAELWHEIKFYAPADAGTYVFNVEVKSADYMGLDSRHQVKMTVIPAGELPEYEAHPDDLELDNEPTLFEQVMQGNLDDSDSDADGNDSDSDSDDSSDDDDDGGDQDDGLSIAERKKRQARLRHKKKSAKDVSVGDDDSSDDDDDDSSSGEEEPALKKKNQ